ncbi:hypothetical protein ACIHFE_04025 [Streptomyces sp. NPDC052396]|uniref:hypothetical protein n=1 Tax=Streptomyces sp. NPDC052396 TaxID=3365689 RepID=UPI0037D73677
MSEYERIAEKGGWHDEAGWFLVIVAGAGAVFAVAAHKPVAWAALLLAPFGVWVWVLGHRFGQRQRELQSVAQEYVRQLMAAQAQGAQIPELSPQLSRLL